MQSVRHVADADLKLHYLYLTFTITSNLHPFNLNIRIVYYSLFHLTLPEFITPLSRQTANCNHLSLLKQMAIATQAMTYFQMGRHSETNVRSFLPRLLKDHTLMAHMKFSSETAKLNYIIKLNY